MEPPTPDELRAIARGELEQPMNEPCPFCGTPKLITRLGHHLIDVHRTELYEAIADYRSE